MSARRNGFSAPSRPAATACQRGARRVAALSPGLSSRRRADGGRARPSQAAGWQARNRWRRRHGSWIGASVSHLPAAATRGPCRCRVVSGQFRRSPAGSEPAAVGHFVRPPTRRAARGGGHAMAAGRRVVFAGPNRTDVARGQRRHARDSGRTARRGGDLLLPGCAFGQVRGDWGCAQARWARGIASLRVASVTDSTAMTSLGATSKGGAGVLPAPGRPRRGIGQRVRQVRPRRPGTAPDRADLASANFGG